MSLDAWKLQMRMSEVVSFDMEGRFHKILVE